MAGRNRIEACGVGRGGSCGETKKDWGAEKVLAERATKSHSIVVERTGKCLPCFDVSAA